DCERFLADDVHAALQRGERLAGVDVVRRADVQHVDAVIVEERPEVVVAAGRPRELHPERAQGELVDARDEPPADDPGAHQRAARNIFVSTSRSSRAPSGGVRTGTPSTMHSWK